MKCWEADGKSMSVTTNRSKSKSEVEFPCDGRLFSETGSSTISAVDCDTALKFSKPINFRHLEFTTVLLLL